MENSATSSSNTYHPLCYPMLEQERLESELNDVWKINFCKIAALIAIIALPMILIGVFAPSFIWIAFAGAGILAKCGVSFLGKSYNEYIKLTRLLKDEGLLISSLNNANKVITPTTKEQAKTILRFRLEKRPNGFAPPTPFYQRLAVVYSQAIPLQLTEKQKRAERKQQQRQVAILSDPSKAPELVLKEVAKVLNAIEVHFFNQLIKNPTDTVRFSDWAIMHVPTYNVSDITRMLTNQLPICTINQTKKDIYYSDLLAL